MISGAAKNPAQTMMITVSRDVRRSVNTPSCHPLHQPVSLLRDAFDRMGWWAKGTPCLFVLITLNHSHQMK